MNDDQLSLPTTATRDVTLAEAKRDMLSKVEEGTQCPCCGRRVQLYKRRLHSEMAAFLCRLVRKHRDEPRYYSTRELCPALTKSATDGSYLVHWGLVEKEPAENHAGGKAGMYRPTEYGIEFANRHGLAASHIYILCGQVMGCSKSLISIDEALGNKFRYEELMEPEKAPIQ